MSNEILAVIVFGGLCGFALVMLWIERRAVTRRKANGTHIDVTDIILMGSKAVAEKNKSEN
ncbi:MAG: hypothetical protein OXE94_02660 [Aestuariivita sp.]|nr:hypothetical protein [Aestuariivita sp.]MCY4203684.1 hypothetical protein [Aestuariivita sp.]MCY4287016.1 hypothetical protein [Aestuariivita sp.]MCY4347663.1 hypothetical protein [Aestuariivita sp.]